LAIFYAKGNARYDLLFQHTKISKTAGNRINSCDKPTLLKSAISVANYKGAQKSL
jgi:hypothetical protein